MPDATPVSRPPRLRRWIRGCRVSALFVSFVVLVPFIYLNLVGLPDFLKRPISASVQRQGIDLAFETMRLFPSGIVVEKVILEAIREKGIPRLMFNEVLLDFDFSKLLSRKLEVESLRLRKGRFEWPLQITNQVTKSLIIDNVGLDLKFLQGDRWKLDQFVARGLGGRVRLTGTLSNASHLRRAGEEKPGRPPRSAETLVANLYRLVQASEQLTFREAPEIGIHFDGDARDLERFKATIDVHAAGVGSPWISLERVALTAALGESPITNSWISWKVLGHVEGVRTKSVSVQDADLDVRVSQCLTNSQEFAANWTLQASRAETSVLVSEGLNASGRHVPAGVGPLLREGILRSEVKVSAVQPRMLAPDPEVRIEGLHAALNAEHLGLSGLQRLELTVGASGVSAPWGRAATFEIAVSGEPLKALETNSVLPFRDPSSLLKDLGIQGKITGTGVIANALGEVEVPRLESEVEWRHPSLRVRDLSVTAFGGVLKMMGEMDWESRACHLDLTSTLDPLALWRKIDPTAAEWSKHVSMESPPEFQASAWFPFPDKPAGNAGSRWGPDWLKSLVSKAELKLGRVDVRGVRFESLGGQAAWSNLVWSAPWFELRHSNGWARLSTSQGIASNTFQAAFTSEIHPREFKSWVNERVGRTLDSLSFGSAPKLILEAVGDWRDLSGIRVKGSLEAQEVGYQSNRFDHLTTRLAYSDSILRFDDLTLRHGEELVTAGSIVYDIPNQWLSFTNGNSSMEVVRVTRLIGPKTTEAVQPYRFAQPPRVKVWGGLNVQDSDFTDMHFEVDAGAFSYWRFQVPKISAQVDWVTNTLTVSNVRSSFYQGRMKGDFFFDFRRTQNGELRFETEFEKADLRTLLADLTSPTNRAEGVLDGKLGITSGLSSDLRTWVGRGDLKLVQGYLWNVPLFSVLSPVLNVFSPGLGSSRGGKAQATFQIRNGQAHTEDLQMQEPVARLRYRGWVDLDGSLSAKVEAEPLGNSWFPGRALSLVLTPLTKLFEYKVTGTLGQPKLEPLYLIPKLLLFPLNPIKNLKELFPEEPKASPKPEPKSGD